MTRPTRVAVVGAGLAGLETCRALRDQGYTGGLTLLGSERWAPYDRPPLSKEVLAGTLGDPTLPFDWQAYDVELRLEVTAEELVDHGLATSAGTVAADAVVLAVGSVPIGLPGTMTLRTRDDSAALHAAFRAQPRVAVVGAGWIGAEVATAAAGHGCDVVVHEALSAPLAAALPEQVGGWTVPWYAEAGIDLRLSSRVDEVADLGADVVVAGLGVRPATRWLDGQVELDGHGGVVVDEHLRSSRPGVWAVGDCASWWSPRYRTRLRVEHWDIALRAPAVVAAGILGDEAVHDPVPYVWSDQLGRRLAYAGRHVDADQMLLRGDPEQDPDWTCAWVTGNRLVAVLTVGRPRDLAQGKRLIDSGTSLDLDRLVEAGVALRDTVAG